MDRLLAEHAIRRVVLESAAAVDAQDYNAFASLFAPQGVLVRPDGSEISGREAIARVYAQRDQNRLTRHLVSNEIVTLHDANQATSRCQILLWSGRHSDAAHPGGRPADPAELLGEFLDDFVLLPEGWRINRRLARFTLQRSA